MSKNLIAFEQWMIEQGLYKSAKKYVGGIKSISKWTETEIFDIDDIVSFRQFKEICINDNSFIEKNTRGNRMYSVSLNHYENFLSNTTVFIAEEILEPELLYEGAKRTIVVNQYERNNKARKACIEKLGTKCMICGFDFGKVYGEEFEGKIHIHHLKPLSEINTEYRVNPELDLIPICPNCHYVIHCTSDGPLSPEFVKNLIEINK